MIASLLYMYEDVLLFLSYDILNLNKYCTLPIIWYLGSHLLDTETVAILAGVHITEFSLKQLC